MFEFSNNTNMQADGNLYNIETAVIPSSISDCETQEEFNEQIFLAKTHKMLIEPHIARQLLRRGNVICDIKPLSKPIHTGKKPSGFIFELTDKLLKDYKEITGFDLQI